LNSIKIIHKSVISIEKPFGIDSKSGIVRDVFLCYTIKKFDRVKGRSA